MSLRTTAGGMSGLDGLCEFGEALGDEGFSAVLVLLGGDGVGDFEDVGVAVSAGELGGGGEGLFGTDEIHVLVGLAVDVELQFDAAAEGGVAGGAERSVQHPFHAIVEQSRACL